MDGKTFTDRPAAPLPHLTGSDFLGAFENAVKENPISAALIGMGVMWLFTGGDTTPLFGRRKSLFGTVQQGADATAHAVQSGLNTAGSSVSSAAGGAAGTARAAASQLSETVHDVGDAASKTAHEIANRSGQAVSQTAHYLERSGEKWGGALQHNVADLFEQHPLVLGVVGLAIGAGIAASLPTTEAEQKLMGEASDFVHDQVSAVTTQVKELANTAVEEAKAQI